MSAADTGELLAPHLLEALTELAAGDMIRAELAAGLRLLGLARSCGPASLFTEPSPAGLLVLSYARALRTSRALAAAFSD